MKLNNRGVSLVEMIVGLAMMAVIFLAVETYMRSTNKTVKGVTEDMQAQILTLGAEKIILNDIANVNPSFNYLNTPDDDGNQFFSLDYVDVCEADDCGRKLTLSVPDGSEYSDQAMYMIVVKGVGGERLSWAVPPHKVFNSSNNYAGINYQVADEDFSISKTDRTDSPWAKDRLLILSSNVSYYDCLNGVLSSSTTCNFTCAGSNNCNKPLKRQFKILGVVNEDEDELSYVAITDSIHSAANLRLKHFKNCRKGTNNLCVPASVNLVGGTTGIITPKIFFEQMPVYPGLDNRSTLQPVELVKYYLYRQDGADKDKTVLIRESATYQGGSLKFTKSHKLLFGLESIEFTRENISQSGIGMKINRYSRYNQ